MNFYFPFSLSLQSLVITILLAEAGASDLKHSAKFRKSYEKLLVAVQEYWSNVGVTLDDQVEGIKAVRAKDITDALRIVGEKNIAVLVDPEGACISELKPTSPIPESAWKDPAERGNGER